MSNKALNINIDDIKKLESYIFSILNTYGKYKIINREYITSAFYPKTYPKYYPKIYDNTIIVSITITTLYNVAEKINNNWPRDYSSEYFKKYNNIWKSKIKYNKDRNGYNINIILIRDLLTVKEINLDVIFGYANESYKLKDKKFYVSSRPIRKIDNKKVYFHYALLQPYEQKAFSSYLPGNIDDVEKIVISARDKKKFKSFYCTICASGEVDNISKIEYDKSGTNMKLYSGKNGFQPEEEPNYSLIIRYNVILEGINFYITGTSPQYLYDHLLLFPESHISTYLMLLSKSHLVGIYSLLKENIGVTGIFNGNYGSDV